MPMTSSMAEKLRALRALAEGHGGTEAERLAAAEAYERLLRKYHLDASEIELRAEGASHIALDVGNQYDMAFRMGGAIARFTKCRWWGQPRTETLKEGRKWVQRDAGALHFVGLQSDMEFAEWLTRSLLAHIHRECMSWILDGAVGATFRGDAQAFGLAASQRIEERIRAMTQPDAPGTALVVVRDKLVDEEFTRVAPKSLTFVHAKQADLDRRAAIHAGLQAGDRASFAKPTSYQKPLQIGGK